MPRGRVLYDELDLAENPIIDSQWDSMARIRRSMEGVIDRVQPEIEFERPRFGRKRVYKKVDGVKVFTGEYEESISGGPFLAIDPPLNVVTSEGKKLSIRKASLFTWTTKMSCPSFSIPAGPPKSMGSCPAATQRAVEAEGSYKQFHQPIEGRKYICDLCYAGKSNYLLYKAVSSGQLARLAWAEQETQKGAFARRVTEAIAAMIQDPKVREVLARKLVSANYFRLHDSGDFHVPDYYRAWIEVCYALPQIHFWAPTRMWVFPKWRALFENYPPPENLALRPSALFIGAKPPAVPGLDGGTTSQTAKMARPIWNCPAYLVDEHSCASAKCRKCWTSQETEVNYKTH